MPFDKILRSDKFDSTSMAYVAAHDDGLSRKEQVFSTVIIIFCNLILALLLCNQIKCDVCSTLWTVISVTIV